LCFVCLAPTLLAQVDRPALPRVAFQKLHRVAASDAWFEVSGVAAGVFAIYEPHESEETVSYLITGERQALLFDTGVPKGSGKSPHVLP
jgi:hypothetical protein